MDCRERQDQILDYAAGALDPAEAHELRRHLATGCPVCAAALAEAQSTLMYLSTSLAPVTPPASARMKLMARVRAGDQEKTADSWRRWQTMILPSSIAAVLAVAATLLVVYFRTPAPPPAGPDARDAEIALLQNQLRNLNANDAATMQTLDERTQQLKGVQAELDALKKAQPDLKFASLTGAAQPNALGRVFVDPQNGKWYFFTNGMKPLPSGRTYELWLIADNTKIPAGTFDVKAQGAALLQGAVPQIPPGAAVTLAITDEPTGGVPAPTGKLQMAGSLE